jgi:hypothetical protein
MPTTDEPSALQDAHERTDSMSNARNPVPTATQVKDDALVRFAMLILRIHKRRIGKTTIDRKQQSG